MAICSWIPWHDSDEISSVHPDNARNDKVCIPRHNRIMSMPTGITLGKYTGVIAAIMGVGAGLEVLLESYFQYKAYGEGTLSGIEYLLQADSTIFILPTILIGISVIGGYGSVKEKRFVVLAASVPFWLLGLFSFAFGLTVAPAALLFLASGFLLTPSYWAEENRS